MRAPDSIAAAYFVYVLVLAWTLRLPIRRRWQITAAAAAAEAVALTGTALPALPAAWHAWLPVVYLAAAYKISGLFFTAPMPRIERTLAAFDRWLFERLGVERIAARSPRALLEYLEAAYLLSAPLVALALLVPLQTGRAAEVDRFWTLVLLVEFVCFGMLPWMQTRPPWVLEPPGAIEDRGLVMRRANRFVVSRALMPVNTFPSGHSATALAIALAVLPLAPALGGVFLLLALSVALGSVLGRYHYALDAVTGIALTLIVWTALFAWPEAVSQLW